GNDGERRRDDAANHFYRQGSCQRVRGAVTSTSARSQMDGICRMALQQHRFKLAQQGDAHARIPNLALLEVNHAVQTQPAADLGYEWQRKLAYRGALCHTLHGQGAMISLLVASILFWIKRARPITIVKKGAPRCIELNRQMIEVHQWRRLRFGPRLFTPAHLFSHRYTHKSCCAVSLNRRLAKIASD